MNNKKFVLLLLSSFFLTSALWSAPEPLTGLKSIGTGFKHVKLTWTTPYDTPSSSTPSHYELRLSTFNQINTEFKWANNSTIKTYPYVIMLSTNNITGGLTVYHTVTGLTNNQSYFFAIKSSTGNVFTTNKSTDIVGWSGISCMDVLAVPFNTAPGMVGGHNLLNATTTNTATPQLTWGASTAGNDDLSYFDTVAYYVELSTSIAFAEKITKDDIPSNSWAVTPPLNENTTYWWRVKAKDSEGLYSSGYVFQDDIRFVVNATNEAPNPFNLTSPNGTIENGKPTFQWNFTTDPDPVDSVKYTLFYSTASDFNLRITTRVANLATNSSGPQPSVNLIENATYYWKVQAVDSKGKYRVSNSTWTVRINNSNQQPNSFILDSPGNNLIIATTTPTLKWVPAIDPDPGDTLTYRVVYSSSDPNIVLNYQSFPNLTTGQYRTGPLNEDSTYWWKVQVTDSQLSSNQSPIWAFYVNATNNPPYSFNLYTSSGVVNTRTPIFTWQAAMDQNGDPVTYSFYYSKLIDFSISASSQGLTQPSFTPATDLDTNSTYYWKVEARDNHSGVTPSTTWQVTIVNNPPNPFNLLTSSGVVNTRTPKFTWQAAADPNGDPVTYNFYYSKLIDFGISASSQGLTATSFTPAALDPNSTYYWKVEARDNHSGVRTSGVWQVTIINNAPNSFSLLTSSGMANKRTPKFIWQAATDPNGDPVTYNFYYSKLIDFTLSASSQGLVQPSFTPGTALDENSTYYWKVEARDNHSGVTTSGIWDIIINADLQPPNNFNLLSPSNGERVTTGEILFSWETTTDPDPFDYVDSYSLYYSTCSSLNNPGIVSGLKVSTYTIQVSALTEAVTYYWMAKAISKVSGQTNSQTRSFNISNKAPYEFDYTSSSGVIKSTNVSLKWKNANDPENDPVTYTVYYSTDLNFSLVKSSGGISVPYYGLTALTDHTTYYWYVNATDVRGNNTIQSDKVWSFRVNNINYPPLSFNLLYPPDGTHLSGVTTYLQWQKTTDPDLKSSVAYTLWYSTSQSFALKTVLDRQTSDYFRFANNLLFGTTYYWRVYALGASGNSNDITQTQTWHFTTLGRIKPFVPQNFKASLDVTKTRVTLSWDAVNKNADNSPITNLKGYKIYRSNSLDDIYNVSETTSVSSNVLSWVDTKTSGDVVYYLIRSYNILDVESDNSSLRSAGETNLSIASPSDQSVMVSYSTELLPSTMTIEVIRQDNQDSNVLGSYIVRTVGQNKEVINYTLTEPFILRFRKGSFQAALGRAVTLGSSYAGVFWHNGVNWAYIGGTPDNGDIIVKTPYMGSYQLRKVFGSTEFRILNLWPKIITPNNDGINDAFNCTFENPTSNSVSAAIYDLSGAHVAGFSSLTDAWFIWDGKDEHGDRVSPGIYLYQVKCGTKVSNGTVVVAR
ncbi:MAG: gliding motility-associated C-terminal domain-containing protein [Elusimicrobia bacterium]|nr:gliding motility-associated C-terminal domain-containing protein [Candidatus Liberimonas magnetica]